MKGFAAFLERYLMPLAGRVAAQRHLGAVRDGIVVTMPYLIIGSIVLVLGNLPIKALADALAPFRPYIVAPYFATFAVLTIFATFGIGYAMAQRYKLDAVAGGMMALVAFFLSTPVGADGWSFSMGYLSAGGLFVGIICALLAVEIYRFFVARKIVITMPAAVPPAVSRSFSALLPGAGVVVVFWALQVALWIFGKNVLHAEAQFSLHDVVAKLLTAPLTGLAGSIWGALATVLILHLLWSVGIHGGNIMAGITGPIFLALMDQNVKAFAAGQAATNVFTSSFFDIFVYVGGAGSTLGLAIVMAFFAKSQQLKTLGRLSVGPGIFNINEPILFGAPIVMNPLLLVPFIGTPLILTVLTWLAMSTGLLARTVALAPWTSPFFLGGFVSTNSAMGLVMACINVVLATAIYYPFFRLYDAQKLREESGETGSQAA